MRSAPLVSAYSARLSAALQEHGLEIVCEVPVDEEIASMDVESRSILEISVSSKAFQAMNSFISNHPGKGS